MKRLVLWSAFVVVAVAAAVTPVLAQAANGAVRDGRVFAGETLAYDAKINKLRISISVAELTFKAETAPGDRDKLLVTSEAESKGTLLKFFRYSFLQRYESIIDLANFRITRTNKHDVQKKRIRDSEAVFDYADKQVTFVETDPNDPMKPPRRIASDITDRMHDIVSAIYSLRLQPLAVGKRYEMQISDSGLVYTVPVVVTAREVQKSVLGKMQCLRVEPEVFGPGRLIEQKGKMVIWMTDDDRHIPVRAQFNTNVGKVNIKLTSARSTPPSS